MEDRKSHITTPTASPSFRQINPFSLWGLSHDALLEVNGEYNMSEWQFTSSVTSVFLVSVKRDLQGLVSWRGVSSSNTDGVPARRRAPPPPPPLGRLVRPQGQKRGVFPEHQRHCYKNNCPLSRKQINSSVIVYFYFWRFQNTLVMFLAIKSVALFFKKYLKTTIINNAEIKVEVRMQRFQEN